MTDVESFKDLLNKTICWAMDRGYSPQEILGALGETGEEIEQGLAQREGED